VSSTYQAILEQGEARRARNVLVRQASRHLGAADDETVAAIEAIDDVGVLDSLIDRSVSATSWEDLLTGVEP
jgi:hypothetical protein